MSSSWRRSWAVSLLAVVLGLACAQAPDGGAAAAAPDPEVQACKAGWMGAYAAKDPAIERLLTKGKGWVALRESRFYDAIQEFSASGEPEPGLVRTYQAFADLYQALDGLFLDVESLYLPEAGAGSPSLEARLGWVALRRGDLPTARKVFGGKREAAGGYLGVLAQAGLAYLEGDADRLRALTRKAGSPNTDDERVMGLVACYLWGVPCPTGDRTPYGQALDAFRQGDLASGVLALEMVDFHQVGSAPGPDLYLYELLKRGFGGLAADTARALRAPFWAGLGAEAQGAWDGAASWFGKTPVRKAMDIWLFGPVTGPGEAPALARVREGAALYRLGRKGEALARWRAVAEGQPGPLVLATLAALQAELGAAEPLGDPVESARAAVRTVEALPERLAEEPDSAALAELYPVRRAEVARLAARVFWSRGLDGEALEVLDRVHDKSQGSRPDFRNPPAYLVDLARAYARVGQFAPAVGLLFDLTREYPTARLAYESLKRLYASRTGGEVPPR